jgi:hypothetical protein
VQALNRLHSGPDEADIEVIMMAKIVYLVEVKKTPEERDGGAAGRAVTR